jgi:acetyl/propionyl-CoA carboxylase alpha subunit
VKKILIANIEAATIISFAHRLTRIRAVIYRRYIPHEILIARGEIAARAIRTFKKLGYRSIAVYSDPDYSAPHVELADEAHRLGPGPVSESYLLQEKLLETALASGAHAVFPGYGLLSENTDFARFVRMPE